MTSVPYSTRKTQSVNSLTNANIAPTPTDNDVLTYKSATNSWINQSIAGGSAINAQTVDITDNNTDTTLYIVLTDNAGVNQSLNVDSMTTPISVNPSTGDLNVVDTLVVNDTQVRCGKSAGSSLQGVGCVAVGQSAGAENQQKNAVAVGARAGEEEQSGIAVGADSGRVTQGLAAIAIGSSAGNSKQGKNAIAIGSSAASSQQGGGAIAIGLSAGNLTQGRQSIAIGTNTASNIQPDNQIFINASGAAVNGATASACYITPIRGVAHGIGVGVMKYDPVLFEVTYSTS
tara:strand:- start:5759 stop:6622 length:864 start_codon:yes stop_codon:yes gene_type:complete